MGVVVDRTGVGRWRWTCPRGHIRWERRGENIWCIACSRGARFGTGRYHKIIDQKERREIPFEEVAEQ